MSVALLGLTLFPTACMGQDDGDGDAARSLDNEPFHPLFSMSEIEFSRWILPLDTETRSRILANPKAFLDQLAQFAIADEELLWLVDKEHPLPADYGPPDLIALDEYAGSIDVDRSGHRLRRIVLPDLLEMVEAARVDEVELLVASAFRSYEYQGQVYGRLVKELGRGEADRISARPGTSQHQLGTTLDFGCICGEFAETRSGRWVAANAWSYGFSLSYPEGYESVTGYSYEAWHLRYIGKSAARMEQEFFAGIQQHLIEFADASVEAILSFLIDI